MEDKELKKLIKEAFVTQFNLFDTPTTSKVKKGRKKMSEFEKEERKQERERIKKIEAMKKFQKDWSDRGVEQGELFPEN